MKTVYLVTGPTGSVGKYLVKKLTKKNFNVYSAKVDYSKYDTARTVFDYLDREYDRVIILHTAFRHVTNYWDSTWGDYNENMKMYFNIRSNMRANDVLFNFGSGIIKTSQQNWYKTAKTEINTEIFKNSKTDWPDGFYNDGPLLGIAHDILLYGLMDPTEPPKKFVSAMVRALVNNEVAAFDRDRMYSFSSYRSILKAVLKFPLEQHSTEIRIGTVPRSLSSYAHMIAEVLMEMGEIDSYAVQSKGVGEDSYPISKMIHVDFLKEFKKDAKKYIKAQKNKQEKNE
jgi:hypothetical protein